MSVGYNLFGLKTGTAVSFTTATECTLEKVCQANAGSQIREKELASQYTRRTHCQAGRPGEKHSHTLPANGVAELSTLALEKLVY